MYETGVCVAFLIWVWQLIMIVVTANSQFSRNLAKTGFRVSWWTSQPVPLTRQYRDRPFWRTALSYLVFAFVGFVFIWLSWVQVALVVGLVVYGKSKDAGAPAAVKEFRWKMRNRELSLDECIRGAMLAQEVSEEHFAAHKESYLQHLRDAGLLTSNQQS